MNIQEQSRAAIPLANFASYEQLRQPRHGKAPVFTLSMEAISKMPPLPVVDWSSIHHVPPAIVNLSNHSLSDPLPKADIVVVTWTNAEWAALDHVFCSSGEVMSYNAIANTKAWDGGWMFYGKNFSSVVSQLTWESPSKLNNAWGRFALVKIKGKTVLLFKSDMHISTDGPDLPVKQLVSQIIADCSCKTIITSGTAGGARIADNLGTVNITNSAHFLLGGKLGTNIFNNKTFSCDINFSASQLKLIHPLLLQTPVTTVRLQELLNQINSKDKSAYLMSDVINSETEPNEIPPLVNYVTVPVLTTNTYDVGNTAGNYQDYAAMEMDDAIVAMQCSQANVSFAVIRNISDPVQNAALPIHIQQSWGGSVYSVYGFYSSYNSALTAWNIARLLTM